MSQGQCQQGLKQAEHGIHLCLNEGKGILKKDLGQNAEPQDAD